MTDVKRDGVVVVESDNRETEREKQAHEPRRPKRGTGQDSAARSPQRPPWKQNTESEWRRMTRGMVESAMDALCAPSPRRVDGIAPG